MLINNLSAHVTSYRSSIDAAIKRVLDRAWLVLGPEVENFEKLFADYIQVAQCRSVANGTDALELALRALGVKAGDKVATVANAGMYTSTAILSIGGTPIFMDVDLVTQVVMQSEVERAITQGVKAVVVTHLYGQAQLDIAGIADKCRTAGVALVEDCAQAHGARVNGKRVGSFGDAGCFSFYPTKNLGALGDGGAVVCSDAELAEKVGHLRQYGWLAKYQVAMAGARNSRLDEVQAAVLSEFLPHLDSWNARRRDIASQYSQRIRHPAVILPSIGGDDYVAHLYVVRCSERDSLRQHLRKVDIATDVHYPIPDHRQPIFGNRFSDVRLPNTEQLAQEVLTLPCYPEMTDEDVEQVISAVNNWPVAALEKGGN
ncbi:DegT/DnrJ/EryC1/StrS family aminotransferase [Polynucleobacter sp. 39-46-10]|uniref:DegT/DnrJ/EryC1/StrS family aminotransferase n=1 Tax=Polynucleobacter sp. 39-46-10 TaxID=1970428 RepID=UPI000BCE9E3C|nr:DegT/DnrJ/EryC1/StrS family aminotransferase [Polynucleobacter sp. 39-46-10]OZA77437.1 MAG: erythromycin biosynthesis sensory transduction protein eryC1 [Polynucleobacter sp. 39-46-10]